MGSHSLSRDEIVRYLAKALDPAERRRMAEIYEKQIGLDMNRLIADAAYTALKGAAR